MPLSVLLVPAIIVADLALMALLVWAILRIGWRPIMRSWPPVEPAPDAVVKRFQSFRFGILNFGKCIDVAADEAYLHLTPIAVLRWVGAGGLSVPWESIAIKKRSRSEKWTTASFDRMTVLGPSWCLDLAAPAQPEDSGGGETAPSTPINATAEER